MDNEKISELLQDTKFMEKVLEAVSEEEVKEIFGEKGVKLKEGEINILAKEIEKNALEAGILSEQELQDISGGVSNLGAAAIGIGGMLIGASAMTPVTAWAFKKGVNYADSWWRHCIHGYELNPKSN